MAVLECGGRTLTGKPCMTSNVRTWMLAVGGSLGVHVTAIAALSMALAAFRSHAPIIELPSGSGTEIQVSLAAVEEIGMGEPAEPPVIDLSKAEDLPELVAVSDLVIVEDCSAAEEPLSETALSQAEPSPSVESNVSSINES